MSCLMHLLVKYQLDDVKSMIVGIENMLEHYKEKGVCIIKNCVSLPVVSKILMHRSAEKKQIYISHFFINHQVILSYYFKKK